MSFARFMDLALYDPDGGYYRSADATTRPWRRLRHGAGAPPHLRGDGGASGGGCVGGAGQPDPFVVQEHGAGEGALAVPLPRCVAAQRSAMPPSRSTDRRLATLHRRLAGADLADRTAEVHRWRAVRWRESIANEVLDALPVHRMPAAGRHAPRTGRRTSRPTAPSSKSRSSRRLRRSLSAWPPKVSSSSRARPPRSALAVDDWVASGRRPAPPRPAAADRLRRDRGGAVRRGPAAGRHPARVCPPPGLPTTRTGSSADRT